ncbi:hypothetical protein SAMN06265171_105250 [Chryseobacterium rhizoplanae]|uniref:Uncharacterized protein n=1 Tax=Chryseobacterium rhizoplanae TaxID=1609531 RepID=A0A521DLL9_9FLAO|nr:hypothetical protein [Chryseobacterium rhizoplanae]SMO72609.1 hypothetical protein SAMN06265171_105250 [Chryseobacterium rhizoplanae]
MLKPCIFLLSGLLFLSCSNKSGNTGISYHSVIQNIPITDTLKAVKSQEAERTVTNAVITRIVDMHQFPIEIHEELTNENQKLVLHLRNIRRTKISGRIIPESGQDNIRFNNIELNQRSIDGPFGKDFEYELNKVGDYSIVIQKSLMASGSQIGKFRIILK